MQVSALFPLLLAVALAVPRVALDAQTSDPAKSSIRLRIAGGADLGVGDTYLAGGNGFAAIGLDWLHPRVPLSARLEASYARQRERDRLFFSDGCETQCFYRQREEVFGLTLDGRYTFFARSSVRPYLFSGFGIHQSRARITTNLTPCETVCSLAAGPATIFSDRSVGVGLHSGFGLAVPVRGSELSVELRYRQLTGTVSSQHTFPILMGFRF